MTETRDFWSRRKAAVQAEAEAEEIALQTAETGRVQAELAEKSDEEILSELDLPDPDTLKMFRARAGSAVVKGAAAGAGIDLLTGGLSLGAATAIGAGAGLLISGGKRFGRDLSARVRRQRQLCVDEATLAVIWHRQRHLLDALIDRGHAAQQAVAFGEFTDTELPEQWPAWLSRIRSNRHWTRLDGNANLSDPDREQLVEEIAAQVLIRT